MIFFQCPPSSTCKSVSNTTACTLVTLVRPKPDRSATASLAIPVSRRWCEFLSLVLSVGGVAPCRLSYPGSFQGNEIGDGGAGAVAAAAGTMPCLETLKWVLVRFPLFHHLLFLPLSHQSLPILVGHVMEDRERKIDTWARVVRVQSFQTLPLSRHFR